MTFDVHTATTQTSGQRRWAASDVAALGMSLGLCGVGLLSLIYQDFALFWEPVPKSLPAHDAFADTSGGLLIVGGVMMIDKRTRMWGALLAAAFIGSWVLVLHLPSALARPANLGAWQAVCESLAMATGAFITSQVCNGRWIRVGGVVMGICYGVFGLSHFVYANFTMSMVPTWLPMRLPLTYLTGAVHILAGLAVITGLQRRWGALAEAAMMSSFVLLVHLPRVAGAPQDRTELTGLFIALTLSSAAWVLATSQAVAPRVQSTP